ncbi:hypothetical protein LVD13_13605 [Flavobacteriaceae bacterium D16]|nr:hypothetical protein [Flavobacteriaceae bacterium D16]
MRILFFILLIVCLSSCKQREVADQRDYTLKEAVNMTREAGDSIVLTFPADEEAVPGLLVKNAQGSTVLTGKKTGNEWHYFLPEFLSNKSGIASWVLLKTNSPLPNGQIQINPSPERQNMIETYLGPKSIRTGGNNHSMLVALPTDIYDNLLADNSPVGISRQLEENIITDTAFTKNGLVWASLYSPEKSGVMLTSAAFENSQSKELSIQVQPENAVDFKVSFKRVHPYADGHQLLTLSSSRITDSYGNTISDGTLVNYEVETAAGQILQAVATTILGVATATFLHPEYPDTWKISAYITGIAQSNTLSLEFKPAFADYSITLSKNNRVLTIGPIRSFMDQIIPDGMSIVWEITDKAGTSKKAATSTRHGKGQLILDSGLFPPGNYEVTSIVGGIRKTITVRLSDDPLE